MIQNHSRWDTEQMDLPFPLPVDVRLRYDGRHFTFGTCFGQIQVVRSAYIVEYVRNTNPGNRHFGYFMRVLEFIAVKEKKDVIVAKVRSQLLIEILVSHGYGMVLGDDTRIDCHYYTSYVKKRVNLIEPFFDAECKCEVAK